MKIYIVADPQGNEIYRNTNFYAAVKKAIEHGFEYVVEYDHDHRGNLIKTILGWNACVVSYNVAVKLFAGNAQVLKKLEEMHAAKEKEAGEKTNEVYLYAEKSNSFMCMDEYNFKKISI